MLVGGSGWEGWVGVILGQSWVGLGGCINCGCMSYCSVVVCGVDRLLRESGELDYRSTV